MEKRTHFHFLLKKSGESALHLDGNTPFLTPTGALFVSNAHIHGPAGGSGTNVLPNGHINAHKLLYIQRINLTAVW